MHDRTDLLNPRDKRHPDPDIATDDRLAVTIAAGHGAASTGGAK